MSQLTTINTAEKRIQLLLDLQTSLETRKSEEIRYAFDRLEPLDRSLLLNLAPPKPKMEYGKAKTRSEYVRETRAVRQVLALLQSQTPQILPGLTRARISIPDQDARSATPSPPPYLTKKRRAEDSAPVSAPSRSFRILPPATHATNQQLPAVFFHVAVRILHPRDLSALACTQRQTSHLLQTVCASQPIAMRMKHAIGTDDVVALRKHMATMTKTRCLTIINSALINTPHLLSECMIEGSMKCLDLLATEGADLNFKTHSLQTALHYTSLHNRPEMLAYCLNRLVIGESATEASKRLLHARDRLGRTPLLCSAESGSMDCLRLLLRAKADIIDVNNSKQNIIHIAIKTNHFHFAERALGHVSKDVAETLVAMKTVKTYTPLFYILVNGDTEDTRLRMVDILLRYGIEPFHVNLMGNNFAHLAAQYSCDSILERFLAYLPLPLRKQMANMFNLAGNTPIMVAVRANSIACVRLLVAAGGNLLTVNNKNQSPLGWCYKPSRADLRAFLLEKEPRLEGFHALNLFMHVFGMEQNAKLGGIRGKKLLFNGSTSSLMRDEFVKFLQNPAVREKIVSYCNVAIYKLLVQAYVNCVIGNADSRKLALQKIRASELVIIAAGWEEHEIDIVWAHGYYIVCNRGEGAVDKAGKQRTFFAQKIDPTRVNEDTLLQIVALLQAPEKTATAYFYTTLPKLLKGKKDPLCKAIEKVAPKLSKAGVCAYSAKKAALRASLALLTKNAELARETAKSTATMHRESVLHYFKTTPTHLGPSAHKKLVTAGNVALGKRHDKMRDALSLPARAS